MLTLGIPTFCVMNGITMAGGLLFALVHDFRIMRDDGNITFVSLSELNVGLSMTPGFAAIVKSLLIPQTSRLLMFGGRFNAQQSLSMKIVDSVYKTKEDLEGHIKAFAKEYAPKGEYRLALKDYKNNLHWEANQKLKEGGITALEMEYAKVFDMSILKGKL